MITCELTIPLSDDEFGSVVKIATDGERAYAYLFSNDDEVYFSEKFKKKLELFYKGKWENCNGDYKFIPTSEHCFKAFLDVAELMEILVKLRFPSCNKHFTCYYKAENCYYDYREMWRYLIKEDEYFGGNASHFDVKNFSVDCIHKEIRKINDNEIQSKIMNIIEKLFPTVEV